MNNFPASGARNFL